MALYGNKMKYIMIEIDTNDADYTQKISEISDEELAIIKPLIEAIKQEKGCNWYECSMSNDNCGEKTPIQQYVDTGKCTEEILETFKSFLPYSSDAWGGSLHSIQCVTIFEVTKVEEML